MTDHRRINHRPMNPRLFNKSLSASALAAALLTLALSTACTRTDERSAGQQLDSAVAQAEQRSEVAAAAAKKELAQARTSTEAAADKAGTAIGKAADTVAAKIDSATTSVGSKVADASITAKVNAELAKDPGLSALRINVDTSNGRVLLKGSAPDRSARDRAARLAAGVKGVTGVDNQLDVRG